MTQNHHKWHMCVVAQCVLSVSDWVDHFFGDMPSGNRAHNNVISLASWQDVWKAAALITNLFNMYRSGGFSPAKTLNSSNSLETESNKLEFYFGRVRYFVKYSLPCGLARGLGRFPLTGEKRLAGRFVLVCSLRENSSLLISFILILRASFSFRLWVKCRRRDAELSENNWLISATAAFTNTSIMDKSWDSRFRLPGGMFADMFHFAADEKYVGKKKKEARQNRGVSLEERQHNGLSGSMRLITVILRKRRRRRQPVVDRFSTQTTSTSQQYQMLLCYLIYHWTT